MVDIRRMSVQTMDKTPTSRRSFADLAAIRAEAEQRVEQLIDLLDSLDGDSELEPEVDDEDGADDEECAGDMERGTWCEDHNARRRRGDFFGVSDDYEFWLGAPEKHPSVTYSMMRGAPWIDQRGGCSQVDWAAGDGDDLELDPADEGEPDNLL